MLITTSVMIINCEVCIAIRGVTRILLPQFYLVSDFVWKCIMAILSQPCAITYDIVLEEVLQFQPTTFDFTRISNSAVTRKRVIFK